jgi:hypothetical protein
MIIDQLLRNVQLNVQTEHNGTLKLEWIFDKDVGDQLTTIQCYVQIRSVDTNDGWRWILVDDDLWHNVSTNFSIIIPPIEATRSIKVCLSTNNMSILSDSIGIHLATQCYCIKSMD